MRGLFDRQPGEVPQLNKLGQLGLVGGKLREGRIEVEQFVDVLEITDRSFFRELPLAHIAAQFEALLAASAFNQDSAHRPRRRGEEMRTADMRRTVDASTFADQTYWVSSAANGNSGFGLRASRMVCSMRATMSG